MKRDDEPTETTVRARPERRPAGSRATPEFHGTECAACGPRDPREHLENFRPWPGQPFWIAECISCGSTLAVDPVDPELAEVTAVHPSIPLEPPVRPKETLR
jgi:hypothetical protein